MSWMAKLSKYISRSLREYLILPGRQRAGIGPDDVNLGYRINDIDMGLGWFSAAMQCVSGDTLGIALPQKGGMAILPRSLPIGEQVELGKKIKRHKAGFNYNVRTVKPYDLLGGLLELQKQTGYSLFPVVDDDGTLLGLITEKKYHPGKDLGKKVAERMMPLKDVVTAGEGIS
ncbi:MAG: IMP dehydrogenase, partial [Candidatus Aenigmarchaeota archaeon]|nr:IMP dehydrogenase [Candidatus Aenigmarchaeota archaeon]